MGVNMRKDTLFNDNWEFVKTDTAADMAQVLEHGRWKAVDIPHDWLIYNTDDLYETGIGWYRKHFDFCPDPDRRYFVRFEGVYMEPRVYLNGEFAGEWKYGYNTFEIEITKLLKNGMNEMLVVVRHENPNSRWYSGAGIYRNIWIKERPMTYLATDGAYVRTVAEDGGYRLKVSHDITGDFSDCEIQYSLLDGADVVASAGAKGSDTAEFEVKNARLWDIDDPFLYELRIELVKAGTMIDSYSMPVGMRTISVNPDKGFFLNGKHVLLKGVCLHHDLGALGAAFNKAAAKRQLVLMKKMGVNAIRTSHNMPAPDLVSLCDEMGLLVDDEAFDMWRLPKREFDYARFFDEWVARDIANFVRRDRNHPSVIMWSVGNEIYDTHAEPEGGYDTTALLAKEVRQNDPETNGFVTFASNFLEWEPTKRCAGLLDMVGYNYGERLYEAHHREHPDWVIYGSETASTVQSRSVYHFPYSEPILTDYDEQCSSLGNSNTSWGARSSEFCILTERDCEFSAGQFIWSGIDYIGEPTPYSTKNSYFGQADTACFPKDSYYIYQAEWTDYRDAPMVHIFPYWDFNEGQHVDIRVASNAPVVELRFNGELLIREELDHKHGQKLTLDYSMPYTPGVLEALAYDETGKVIARDVQESFSDACSLMAVAESDTAVSDGMDMFFVEIGALDCNGRRVQNANNRVSVTVSGPGRLVGLDNGDSTDYDSYKTDCRKLFMGRLLAMIGTTETAGDIVVTVTGEGLAPAEIVLHSKECGHITGVACTQANEHVPYSTEIPIRKIEIVSDIGNAADAGHKVSELRAVLHPQNATFDDIEWQVLTDSGVKSNLAELLADGLSARLIVKGDGHFNVRCYARNGGTHVNVSSQLDFSASGIGKAFINPYEPVASALNDVRDTEFGNASLHAISAPSGRTSYFGFTNMEFGNFGSDEVTLTLFCFDQKDCRVDVYAGIPDDGEFLGSGIYNRPSIWDVYQPLNIKLSRRLTGNNTVCFKFYDFISVKDITFAKPDKAHIKVYAAECDRIYGDEYSVSGQYVNGIGNNVSIEFEDMDFKDGVTRITVKGRSHIKINTLHLLFTDGNGTEQRRMLEIPYSDEPVENTFEIEAVSGLQKLSFVALPGSHFDFEWFKFS